MFCHPKTVVTGNQFDEAKLAVLTDRLASMGISICFIALVNLLKKVFNRSLLYERPCTLPIMHTIPNAI